MNAKQTVVQLQTLLFLALSLLSSVAFASDYNLQHNRWALLSIPANSSAQTIEQLFSDDLSPSTYGEDWVIFNFDHATQGYVKAALENSLAQGDGFWMLQITGADVTIDLPADLPEGDAQISDACATTEGCFSARVLTASNNVTWSLVGAPFSDPIDVAQIRVLSADGDCVSGCDLEQVNSAGSLSNEQWTYSGSENKYVALTDAAELSAWQGVWVQAEAQVTDIRLSVLFPKSGGSTNDDNVNGFHTSLSELRAIKARAQNGSQADSSNITRVVDAANEGWTYGTVGTPFGGTAGTEIYDKRCVRLNDPDTASIIPTSGSKIFSMVLSYIFTDSATYAADARSILLDFSRSSGYEKVEGQVKYNGANQCAFEIGLFVPLLIESAMLMEAYPEWTAADKAKLQAWLATEVYPVTAAIARTRKNNWGTAAAFASWAIGHYLTGSGLRLDEVYPTAQSFTPAEAKREHLQTQLDIVGNNWAGDTRCLKFGFQKHGGFPDELRRGSTGCDGTYLHSNDKSYSYQIRTMNHLIYHAEALQRHGNNELYDYKIGNSESLILNGILFVIENSNGTSYDWLKHNLGVLRLANDFYDDERLCQQIAKGTTFRQGRYLPYTRATYPQVCQ